ncbi:G-protein coupled receptor Mth2-like [Anoplophora glabripennis]|uniref:G-protein coupled receptor Mth2-like n=1 Tax=Anoplophora glabripennis TaxID=217634 RepID=UPI0008749B0E|nr:G-protein coupled receptor Mth2-like [Anoplophora glabripennis]
MKIIVLVLLLVFIKQIKSEADNNDTLNLCRNATVNVDYENYTDASIQNCGCENQETCIRKCCQIGFFYYQDEDPDATSYKSVCSKHESNAFSVPVYDGEQKVRDVTENFLIGMLNCSDTNVLYVKLNSTEPNRIFYVQNNGSLYYPYYDLILSNERYCVDESDGLGAYLCFEPEEDNKLETIIHVTAKLISVPFLLVTGLVYALLPERNLHRTALMLHVFSLLLGNGLLAIGQYVVIEDDNLCFCLGYSILLFMVASFFWMNVICIDIWLAFSGLRGFYVQEKIKRRIFAVASCYAWGLPILNVLIVFLLSTYGDENAKYHPGIGVESCFLKNGLATHLFYFGPILVIIVINIVLFILTALNIQKVKRETRIVETKKHSNREDDKFKLYWKLLFVMGLNPVVNTHIIQLISWSLGREFDHNVIVYVWYYKDFSHAAYGILIFVIFVCQKKIWISLKERFHWIYKSNKNDSKASVTTSTGTSSSENNPSGIRLRGMQNMAAEVP